MPFFSLPTGGSPVLADTTGPSGSIGNVGDIFIDKSAKLLYGPKEAGGWPSGPIDLSLGPTGGAGPTGPTAPASTLTIGTVVAGSPPSASITGTAPSQIINFTIPFVTGPTGASVTGATGPQGVASTGPTGPSGGPTGPTGNDGGYDNAQLINARTADYTLVLSDAGKLVTLSAATGTLYLTLPPASSVAFATGTHVDVARLGTGIVSITGGTGVSVNSGNGTQLRAKFSAASCVLYANDTWLVVGDTTT
jgi:hypothetical protein